MDAFFYLIPGLIMAGALFAGFFFAGFFFGTVFFAAFFAGITSLLFLALRRFLWVRNASFITKDQRDKGTKRLKGTKVPFSLHPLGPFVASSFCAEPIHPQKFPQFPI